MRIDPEKHSCPVDLPDRYFEYDLWALFAAA
jgi:hypothetical protein